MDHMSAGPRTHRQENGSDVRVGILLRDCGETSL